MHAACARGSCRIPPRPCAPEPARLACVSPPHPWPASALPSGSTARAELTEAILQVSAARLGTAPPLSPVCALTLCIPACVTSPLRRQPSIHARMRLRARRTALQIAGPAPLRVLYGRVAARLPLPRTDADHRYACTCADSVVAVCVSSLALIFQRARSAEPATTTRRIFSACNGDSRECRCSTQRG